MSIQHLYTLTCIYTIEGKDGKVSFIDVFQNVRLMSIPGPMIMSLAVGLAGDNDDTFSIVVEDPDGEKIVSTEERKITESDRGDMENPYAIPIAVNVIQFRPLIFHKPGVHSIILESRGEVIHRHPLPVFQALETEETDDTGME